MSVAISPASRLGPVAALGRLALSCVAALGAVKLLAWSALRAGWRPPADAGVKPRRTALARELGWMLGMGLPLVMLIHLAVGGFLAMQAYFGATFVLAAGPVVLIGLFRNLAPLLSALVLVGLLASRTTATLAEKGWTGSPGWAAFGPVAAAMIAAPILILAGAVAGTLCGAVMARNHLGVHLSDFFRHGWGMLWLRDLVSIPAKGMIFGMVAGLVACSEGMRLDLRRPLAAACYRAALVGTIAVLFVNTSWFVLFYKAGPPFGPTVLTPPIP